MSKGKVDCITRVDPALYKKFKAACIYYCLDMRKVFIKHMQAIVDDLAWAIDHGHISEKSHIFETFNEEKQDAKK